MIENRPIPTDLRHEAIDLQRGSQWIDDGAALIDDEYRWAGTKDPKIIITTSHDPSSRLKVFAKVDYNCVFQFLFDDDHLGNEINISE